ncbi:hypothetical protein KO489_08710 [Reinekea forsetii]|nr:hypothetical protein [Reinekea forsetii]
MNLAPLPALIGHRGLPSLAPENTAASIRSAVDNGIEWIELDVTMAGDESLVMMHDPDCRLFKQPDIKLAKLNKDALKKIDAGRWFSDEFAGEPLLFCEDMLALVHKTGVGLNLEIKINPDLDTQRQVDLIWAELQRYTEMFDRILISSFSIPALSHLRSLSDAIKIGVLFEKVPSNALEITSTLKAASLHCDQSHLSQELALTLSEAMPLYCYTVNDTVTLNKLLSWGVSGVFCDRAHADDLKAIVKEHQLTQKA